MNKTHTYVRCRKNLSQQVKALPSPAKNANANRVNNFSIINLWNRG